MSEKWYLVRWEIEIDASTPEEAAQKALTIQRDPDSTATVFKVWDARRRELPMAAVNVCVRNPTAPQTAKEEE